VAAPGTTRRTSSATSPRPPPSIDPRRTASVASGTSRERHLPRSYRVEARDDTTPDWIRERVSFTAAYGDERLIAQVFLPRGGRPPFQTVVYFPGSSAITAGPSDELGQRPAFKLLTHFLKSGRAVLYPVYKGTHERSDGKPDYYRALDYLASRSDFDNRRVAFQGLIWGGWVAPMVLAVESRFAAAIVVLGGLNPRARPRPEVDTLNYAPHVKLPVLMLNGRYDLVFPLGPSVRPLFERIGTSSGDKVLRVCESDHSIPRAELIRESLAWLDKYLGPVQTAAAQTTEAKPSPRAR